MTVLLEAKVNICLDIFDDQIIQVVIAKEQYSVYKISTINILDLEK